MPVTQQTPIVQYTGNGVTTVFPFGFQILLSADLTVKVNGVTQLLTTQYALSGIGAPLGGSVTFVSAPANGADVVIYRDVALERTTDYQENGDLLAQTLDADFDRVWQAIQDIDAIGSQRGLRAPVGELVNELPAAADRYNKVLSFDADGQPIVLAPADGSAVALANTLAASGGSANIGYLQAGAGASARTVQAKLREIVSVTDFGADPAGVLDSTAAFNAALISATGVQVMVPPGNYKISGTVSIPANASLIGPAGKATITTTAATFALFQIAGSDVTLANFVIQNALKTGGYDITIVCGTATKERITVENIISFNSRGFITDSGSGSGYHITTNIRMCQARQHNGPGLAFTRAFAFQFYERVAIDFVNVSTANYTGFSLSGAGLGAGSGGYILEDCDVLGTSGTHVNANQHGYSFADCAEVWLRRTTADTCDGKGYIFNTVNKLHLETVSAGLCNNTLYEFTSVTNSDGVGIKAFGRNGLGGEAANIDGLRFVSGNSIIAFANVLVRDCTGHGVNKNAAQTSAINISQLMSAANVGRGLRSTGNSALLVTGATLTGNTAGNYDLGGSSDFLHVSQLNSGAVVSVGPGPVSA